MSSAAIVTYGPIFIGVVFNILLYGIMAAQTYVYFMLSKNDKLSMKLFVTLLFVCDTLNCAFDVSCVYMALINGYGNVEALNRATWIFATDPAMTAIIALLVQTFFAWRIKTLTNNWIIVAFILLCSFCQWCGGVGTAIAVGMVPEFQGFRKFEVIVIVWLAFSILADTGITVVLVCHLRRHRTGFSTTDDLVNKIIRLTVQTGAITTLCVLVDLIAFLSMSSGVHLIFNLPLSKVYTNSLMSSLNSRAGWPHGTSSGKAFIGSGGGETHSHVFSTIAILGMNVASHQSTSSWQSRVPQVYTDVETVEGHNMEYHDCIGVSRSSTDESIGTLPSHNIKNTEDRLVTACSRLQSH